MCAATEIAYRQGFVSTDVRQASREFCREISKMLNGLIKSIGAKERNLCLKTPNL